MINNKSKHPLYFIWKLMLHRCRNPKSPSYEGYGGRGIGVCDRWNDFENFVKDIGERPKGSSLDRINNNGDYEPNNCKWSTPEEQSNNRRNSAYVEHDGKRMTQAQWARELGISAGLMRVRLNSGAPDHEIFRKGKFPQRQKFKEMRERIEREHRLIGDK